VEKLDSIIRLEAQYIAARHLCAQRREVDGPLARVMHLRIERDRVGSCIRPLGRRFSRHCLVCRGASAKPTRTDVHKAAGP
jgi:hypothetical protein